MQNETQILVPIDYAAFRSGFAIDKKQCRCKDPLSYFSSLIRDFEKLAVGRFFWFILDFPDAKHVASGGDVEYLTPYKTNEFSSMAQIKLHDATHPDDLPKVHAFSRYWIELYDRNGMVLMDDYKVSLFFRMKNNKGIYYWIMAQYPDVILDANNKIVYGLVLVTDISHIKSNGEPMMNVINQKEHFCQQFYCLNVDTLSKTKYTAPQLTGREKEILHLLARGHGSKQIAEMLYISTKTVDNHRQNMLHKTGSKTSSELVGMAIRLSLV